ncbi:MAG: tetratricopeptide repeat protein [Planctomycetes bacterium]|nr:tetratricopeptide repeat protein [Planctomycetota bacterium]
MEARPEGAWERAWRCLRRERGKLLLAAAALAALLVLGWLAWKREEAEREAVRLQYDAVVLGAAREIYRGMPNVLGMEVGGDILRIFQPRLAEKGAGGAGETLRSLAEVAEAVPERPEAPYYLARVLWVLGDAEAARREARRALERASAFVPAEVLLGEAARGAPPLEDTAIEVLCRRYRGGWQEAWLLAYEHTWARRWPEAAEAFGRLLELRRPEGEPYLGLTVEGLMGRGVARLRSGQPRGALQDFAGAWRMWPWFPEAALLLARAWHVLGNPEEAEAVLGELWSSVDATTRDEIGARVATWYWELEEKEKAWEWAERVTGWQRPRVKAWFHYHEGAFEESIEECRAVLAAAPGDRLSAQLLGGSRLHRQGHRFGPGWDEERRDILAHARRSVESHPDYAQAWYILAAALAVNGLGDEALAAAQAGLEVQARAAEQHLAGSFILGLLLRRQGRLEEAEGTLRPALAKEPENRFLRLELASVLEESEIHAEALAEYEALIAQRPRYNSYFPARYHAGAAAALNRLGRHEEALVHASRALESLPRNTAGHEELAFALWKLGRPEEAFAAVEAGLEALPGRVRLHVVRGWILEDARRLEEAVMSFSKALLDHPDCAEAHEGLRRTLQALGKVPDLPVVARLAEVLKARAPEARERKRILATLAVLRGSVPNVEAK